MRVLLIDVNCKSGSTGKIAYDLYRHVNDNGGEAAVCYGRGKKINEKNIYKFGLDWETYLHAFLTRITGFTGCFSYFSTKRLIRFIKKFKPDVVHIHELHAYFVNITQLLNFLKKQNIKVIHTLHCAFSYTGKCGHHLECEKWKESCGHCPHLKDYVSTICFDHTKHMIQEKKKAFAGFKDMTIVCPSQWLADFAKQSFLGQYPVKVINNGVDTSVFYPRETVFLKNKLGINSNEKIVLSVAPNIMSSAKGGDFVLKIASLTKKEAIRYIMVGAVEENVETPENVLIFKRTSNQSELAEFYSLADIFLICSKMETFPTTCLEAQCCGTPIYGFNVGGVKETSILSTDSSFTKYGDINVLSKTIVECKKKSKNDEQKISKLAFDAFDKNLFLAKMLNVYKSKDCYD